MQLKKILFLLFIVFAFGCSQKISNSHKSVTAFDVKVVLLAGQSNMAGSGSFDALDEPMKRRIEKVAPRVLLSIDGKSPKPLSFTYSKYQFDKRGFGNVFGPELFLGLTLAEKYPTQEFLFIKRSQGGTALEGAWNPEWTAEKAAAVEKEGFKRALQLYNLHQQDIKTRLAALERNNKSYNIIGMFWMQGENDAAKEVAARNYEYNLTKLIAGYRAEFNETTLPFVMGQINSSYGRFPDGPEMVRNAMVNVAEKDINVTVVKTSMDKSWKDFPKHDDNVHYDHIGLMRLGIAFTKEWMALTANRL